MAFSRLRKFLSHHDIADNLTTNDAAKVLSAKQGKALSDTIGHFRNASGGSENAASDANTMTSNGIYYRWYASGTNFPGTSGGWLIVTRHNSNAGYGMQLFVEDSIGQNIWVRRNNNGTWQEWQQLALIETGSWTAHIYDYETKKFEVSDQRYFKIGPLYVCILYISSFPSTTFADMFQVRNLPCNTVAGGSVYISAVTGAFGDRCVQNVNGGRAYLRPNFTGTINGGICSGWFIGY